MEIGDKNAAQERCTGPRVVKKCVQCGVRIALEMYPTEMSRASKSFWNEEERSL